MIHDNLATKLSANDRYDRAHSAHVEAMSAFLPDPSEANKGRERDAWNAKNEAIRELRALLGLGI